MQLLKLSEGWHDLKSLQTGAMLAAGSKIEQQWPTAAWQQSSQGSAYGVGERPDHSIYERHR